MSVSSARAAARHNNANACLLWARPSVSTGKRRRTTELASFSLTAAGADKCPPRHVRTPVQLQGMGSASGTFNSNATHAAARSVSKPSAGAAEERTSAATLLNPTQEDRARGSHSTAPLPLPLPLQAGMPRAHHRP